MLSEVIQLAHTDAHTHTHTHTHKIKMNKLFSIETSLSVWGLTCSIQCTVQP